MSTTERDTRILEFFQLNSQATTPEVAKELGISERSAEGRLRVFKDRGMIRRETVVSPAALGFGYVYRIDIKINPRELADSKFTEDEKAAIRSSPAGAIGNQQRELAVAIADVLAPNYPDIRIGDVKILLGGPADLSVTVLARSTEAIFDFVTTGLRVHEGVENTSTSQEAWSYRQATFGNGAMPSPDA